MSDKISRRDFLKLSGVSAAAAAVLTGCGPAARHVMRNPYATMPEFNQTGVSTYYATTCRDCHAGCGLIVRTKEGRAINIQGNPDHPVNQGRLCPRGVTGLQGLYNPDRIEGPRQYTSRGEAASAQITWEQAISAIAGVFTQYSPDEIAFLMGPTPDHLYDFVQELATTLGAPPPLRLNTLAYFDQLATLSAAGKSIYGKEGVPSFDLANADVTLSFGASFLETWMSPMAYSRAYGTMRQGNFGRRGYLIAIEPRQSLTTGNADEWLPAVPGSEGWVALALAKLVAAARQDRAGMDALAGIDVAAASASSGISTEQLQHVAELFAAAERPLAIPGGSALAHANGLANASAILGLNSLVANSGKPGGLYFSPNQPQFSTLADVQQLVIRMASGGVKALFIHGCNPVFELPPHLGFEPALAQVETVLNFATLPDETAAASDLVLPDHSPFESWGYQRGLAGADRVIYATYQPVVAPLHDTKATVDVLLAAFRSALPEKAAGMSYLDEVDFIQKKLLPAQKEADGNFGAPEILTFWSKFLQYGGWWKGESGWIAPSAGVFAPPSMESLNMPPPTPEEYYLSVYPSPILGDGAGANRPWLQETPDPTTTVMWANSLEIHPETAHELGIEDDDIVRVRSGVGEIHAVAYLYPGIRPDTIGISFGQGHTALGRWARDRGANPFHLIPAAWNLAYDLALADTRVQLMPTGQKRPLARLENREGVYGERH